jgi:hypothetical protein
VSSSHTLPAHAFAKKNDHLKTQPGLRLRLGQTAMVANNMGATVTQKDIDEVLGVDDASVAQDDMINVGGYFDFDVSGLAEVGDSVKIVLPLDASIPENAVYRKLIPGEGWQDFIEDTKNSLASAPVSEENVCPETGDDAYEEGLIAGYDCVQLTIEDGGPNDTDGEANGEIQDPGGVSVSGDDLVAGCAYNPKGNFDMLLMLLLASSLFYTRTGWLNRVAGRF